MSDSPVFLSNLDWGDCRVGGAPIECVAAPRLPGRLGVLAQAFQLWRRARRHDSVTLLCATDPSAMPFLALRSLLPGGGRVVAFDLLLHPWTGPRRWLARRALRAADAVVVWSRRQAESGRDFIDADGRFVFLPYKANHSKDDVAGVGPAGDYVFAGGNSERDYRTLFAAVAGLPCRVVVSRTDPAVTAGLDVPVNVELISIREPHFAERMAGARFVVQCIRPGLLRGAGEASLLNAMWHGKPVVAADDVSAADYIDEGVTGHVVPAGDAAALRERVSRLWEDADRCAAMGRAARQVCESRYTHEHWKERLFALALERGR